MKNQQRRQVVIAAAAAAVVALCAQYATLVALEEEQEEEQKALNLKAVWSREETTALIDYLYEHRSQVGSGGNFKAATFDAAAEAISPLLKDGPTKTGRMCKTKWSSVSDFHVLSVLATDTYIQIKYIHSSIRKYQATTGTHCDNINGAGIDGGAVESVWNNYIAQKVCWFVLQYSCKF